MYAFKSKQLWSHFKKSLSQVSKDTLFMSDFLLNVVVAIPCTESVQWLLMVNTEKKSECSHLVVKLVLHFLFKLCCISWICPWNCTLKF